MLRGADLGSFGWYCALRDGRRKGRMGLWWEAMVKITSVVSDGMKAKSSVAMVQALIAGERDPRKIADLARGRRAASGTSSPSRWTACSAPTTA